MEGIFLWIEEEVLFLRTNVSLLAWIQQFCVVEPSALSLPSDLNAARLCSPIESYSERVLPQHLNSLNTHPSCTAVLSIILFSPVHHKSAAKTLFFFFPHRTCVSQVSAQSSFHHSPPFVAVSQESALIFLPLHILLPLQKGYPVQDMGRHSFLQEPHHLWQCLILSIWVFWVLRNVKKTL